MRLGALCLLCLASCSFDEKTINGPSLDRARALLVITVPPEGEPTGWAFEAPLEGRTFVPSAAPADLYALTTGCPLSELGVEPGRVALTGGSGAALPQSDRYHRWRHAIADDLLPVPWFELENRTPLDSVHLVAPARQWCPELAAMERRTIELAGSGTMPLTQDVNPVFGVQLSADEALVGLLTSDSQRGGYFRITVAGAEQLQLTLPPPRGAFVAANQQLVVIAGPARQLYRGNVESGFTVAGSTRAVAIEANTFWIDGAPDGSELFVLGRDGIAEHFHDERWTRLAAFAPTLSYSWGAVLWLGPGEALFTTGLDGGVAHFRDGVLDRIRPIDADSIVALARHPSLGILAGSISGRVLRLILPATWEVIQDVALHDSILSMAPLGEGLIVTGYDNGLGVFHPRFGFCEMGAISDARPILRVGSSVLLVHRSLQLGQPVLLEQVELLPEFVECSALR